MIQTNEPGVTLFKNESMHFKLTIHPSTMQVSPLFPDVPFTHFAPQSLHLSITPASEQHRNQWSPDELQTLERFFEVKVCFLFVSRRPFTLSDGC